MNYTIDKKRIILEMEGAIVGGGFTSAGATTSSLGTTSNSASTGSEAIPRIMDKQIKNKKIKI